MVTFELLVFMRPIGRMRFTPSSYRFRRNVRRIGEKIDNGAVVVVAGGLREVGIMKVYKGPDDGEAGVSSLSAGYFGGAYTAESCC